MAGTFYTPKSTFVLFPTIFTAMKNVQCQNMTCHHQEGSCLIEGLVFVTAVQYEFFIFPLYQKHVAGQPLVKTCK